MELVEKKCPNCGADLKFGPSDSEVKCNYCNTSFMIKKDNNTNIDNSGSVLDPESFELQKKAVKTIGTTILIVFLLIFISSICIFFFVFSKIMSHFNGLL